MFYSASYLISGGDWTFVSEGQSHQRRPWLRDCVARHQFAFSLASGCFRGFSKKKCLNARGFAREFHRSSMLHKPGKVSKVAASLLVCTRKKFFAWGVGFFCEWRHKWRTFRPSRPTLPGPGRQPLGGSISVKLEIRLQFESFDTLDDLPEVAQRIQVASILLHEAKPVLGLFCLHLNAIGWSGHVQDCSAKKVVWKRSSYTKLREGCTKQFE